MLAVGSLLASLLPSTRTSQSIRSSRSSLTGPGQCPHWGIVQLVARVDARLLASSILQESLIDHNPTVFRAACFWVMRLETFSRIHRRVGFVELLFELVPIVGKARKSRTPRFPRTYIPFIDSHRNRTRHPVPWRQKVASTHACLSRRSWKAARQDTMLIFV